MCCVKSQKNADLNLIYAFVDLLLDALIRIHQYLFIFPFSFLLFRSVCMKLSFAIRQLVVTQEYSL
jgi:hypothetical protein